MRDHDGDAAARAHAADRLGQRLLAFARRDWSSARRARPGTGRRRARARARCAGAGRPESSAPPSPICGLVAVAADAGSGRGRRPRVAAGDQLAGIGFGLEARDVLRHGAGEQLDVLRQVADVLAERVRSPIGRARRRRAGSCRARASRRRRARARARILPEPLGPMTPSAVPAASAKLDIVHDAALPPGGTSADARRRAGLRAAAAARIGSARAGSAAAASASRRQLCRAATKLAPVGDRQLDRRQRARRQDRAGDDDAGGRLLLDHQIGAERRARRTAAPCRSSLRQRCRSRRRRRTPLLARQIVARSTSPQRSAMRPRMPSAGSPRRCGARPRRARAARRRLAAARRASARASAIR